MNKTYLDNASTSFPKPPCVAQAVAHFIREVGCNINRGGYENAYSAAEIVLDTREQLRRFFHSSIPVENVIFTPSVTYSLNILVKGLLKPGDHVLVSAMEHNGLMRPLVQMEKLGVTFDRIPCTPLGELILEELESMIRPNTKAVFMLHSSNVCGSVMPIAQVGAICRRHGLRFVVDSAQSAGILPIDMDAMYIDALAFTGHKSLLGPQGIGGFLITEEMAREVSPLISGGTGSISDSEETPDFLPDKFEPGTMNLPAIYGLHAALEYLEQTGIEQVYQTEMARTGEFLDGLSKLGDHLKVIGPNRTVNRGPVVSIDCLHRDNAEVAFLLDSQYGIMTRCGLHCAPNAHKTLGTFPHGTIRFAFSHYNTPQEISYALDSLTKIFQSL